MRRPVGWAAVVLATALVCGSCAGSTELETDRAQALQESVLTVTAAAAEGRWVDAQSLLTDTRAALDAGKDAGEVSTERYDEIVAALDRVAADLAAEQAAADAAAQAAAEQAAAEPVTPEPAAPEVVAPKDKGKKPGKGNGDK
ncbi:mucin-associated surface protein [Cellulomonas humilata]|uniref:Mucin-associated surface protein n=1 Tax=Cellulomonas humilata TaxID=144055 RepID=A0A7Y6DX62_9CELL|nr:hypothetical protein [Cellulomonas humilata]NUU17035.1 mucin-associated surface protein [Cellulomonas humilata]